jgi:hypothetical protein
MILLNLKKQSHEERCEAKESYLTIIIPDAKHDGYYTSSFLLSCTIPLFIRPFGISLNAAYSSEIHTSVR